MGTALTGLEIRDTYDALLKITDNGPLSGSLKVLTDGLGNDSTLSLSTTAASIAGTLAVTGNATFDTTTLVVDAANNRVGIGMATPSVALEVDGAVKFSTSGANGPDLSFGNIGGSTFINNTAGARNYYGAYENVFTNGDNSVEFARITNTGLVGIGTSAPALTLELNSSATAALPATSGSTQSSGGRMRLTTTGAATAVIDFGTAGGSGGWIQATNKSDLTTNYALLLNPNGGNVGIGTSAPAATLDVLGTSFLRGNVNAGKTANINVTTAVNGVGGGNREFDTFTGASSTGFTGTDATDQGHGYFAATIVSGRSYEVSATMVVTNGVPLSFITSTGLNFATDTVQTVEGSPVSGTTYRFVASGNASYFGISASNSGGGMTCVVSNFSLKEVGSVLVTSDSNVGIGTTSPATTLSVVKSSNSGSGSTFPRLSVLNTLATQGDGSSTFNFSDIQVSAGDGAVNMFLATTYAAGTWAPSGQLNVSTNHPLVFKTNNTERMRILADGNVGIGTSAPAEKLSVAGAIITTGAITGHGANRVSISQEGANGAFIQSYGADASTVGAFTFRQASSDFSVTQIPLAITAAGNVGIGTSSPAAGYRLSVVGAFTAALGGAYVEVGDFDRSLMVLNHTNVAVNANLLQVQKSGTGVFTINPAGIVQIASGIQFPATQVASADANTLDDYEEGTFTPTIIGTTTAGTATYGGGQAGSYTKIGRMVYFNIYLGYSGGTGTGDLRIAGLPFTIASSDIPSFSIGTFLNVALTASNVPLTSGVGNSTQVRFDQIPTGGGTQTAVPYDDSAVIAISGCYQV